MSFELRDFTLYLFTPHTCTLFPTFTTMKPALLLFVYLSATIFSCQSQTARPAPAGMTAAADQFLKTLSAKEKSKAQFAFDSEERFDWHYIPKSRQGIPLKELNEAQRKA